MLPFEDYSATQRILKEPYLVAREDALYAHDDLRTDFVRDSNRILHSSAFRRLKHKTQVFPNTDNDHICTRMEHVLHVESVSSILAMNLGLSQDLTKAIALGHDLGHAPFGHQGEYILSNICRQYLGKSFWHEQNGLYFVDSIELLEGPDGKRHNLSLTYAVRDGIISHCGEVHPNGIFPRTSPIDLYTIHAPGVVESITWEGCCVKVADQIAYLGRDIQDAKVLGHLTLEAEEEYLKIAKEFGLTTINTSTIMNEFIVDLCQNSNPDVGLCYSKEMHEMLQKIKDLNYRFIYFGDFFKPFHRYSEQVITEVFRAFLPFYENETYKIPQSYIQKYPTLFGGYVNFIEPYLNAPSTSDNNRKMYLEMNQAKLYLQSVIDYIAGMTDPYLIRSYEELTQF